MKEVIKWLLPIKTVSEANCSEHWTKKKRRHDIQKNWVRIIFKAERTIFLPCHIKLVRIGKRKLDSDNLPVSMKWIRDEIANQLIPGKASGIADDDPRLSWEYDQRRCSSYSIEIIIYEC